MKEIIQSKLQSNENPVRFGMVRKKRITIQEVYPNLSPQEQAEAEYNLREYALLVWRIYKRVKRENPELLTEILKKDRV